MTKNEGPAGEANNVIVYLLPMTLQIIKLKYPISHQKLGEPWINYGNSSLIANSTQNLSGGEINNPILK